MLKDGMEIARQLRQIQRQKRRDTGRLENLKVQAERSAALRKDREENPLHLTYPEALPITARKDEIVRAIREHPVVIVAGETGSGKTTQLPKMCLEAGRGVAAKIACTQPRRVAALSVSRRIAEELNVAWGAEVGCKIRFKDETAPETRIKMMTDGMLLAEIQGDPNLYEYDTIIIDEAHERSLNIDFLLGYLRLLQKRRPELRIVITSATIDTEAFSKAFDNAPIIEVSGRMYPVDVQYLPIEDLAGETYIDAAVTAVDMVVDAGRGDILVFMPTEKDIHETRRRLEGRHFRFTEILPLFGRLTAGDQQKVFYTQRYRRIVVATNIAETSITIPGIRYVIDTGLARISRHNPRNQTHRLPVEEISQSSARQRAGRCGRVQNGVCIRLYDEKSFLARPEYTQPEIQRSDLAEVILRMIALRLGDVETFPFIDPPRSQAIQGGFNVLRALDAIDDRKRLTPLGRDMARLPLAPTVSRMILQAQKERALREVLVIASAISIQDPRVRPLEQEKAADQEHKRFVDGESDFIALLNIWKAYHDTFEKLRTQSQMRKFCKQHFLSFNRMREWRDIYMQIRHTLREMGAFRMNRDDAGYDAIHRSVVSGLLGNVAQKKEDNMYRAARGRDVMLFPGSGLFQRREGGEDDKKSTPGWVVAAEVVETSRLFARTVARIQPSWLAELGGHLCRASYKEPFYSMRSGRVLATETLTLHGLQVGQKRVGYGRIDASAATEIFIREALVNDEVALPYPFVAQNRDLRARVETWQMQQRLMQFLDLDEAAYRFYAERLENVSSTHDLNRLIKRKGTDFLLMSEKHLAGEQVDFDRDAFPNFLEVDGEEVPLSYAYRPGQDRDGVTLQLPYKMVHFVQPEVLDWLVPGLLEEKITHLLRGLPKSIRKRFVPVPDKAREIAAALQPTHGAFLDSLSAHILSHYGIEISQSDWNVRDLPEHLQMRVEVQDEKEQAIVAARDLRVLREQLDAREEDVQSDAWRRAQKQVARRDVTGQTIGELPERIEVMQAGGMPVFGYVGLKREGDRVDVCLFKRAEEAERETQAGWMRLCEREMRDEMRALKRSLGDLAQFEGGREALREGAYANLMAHLFTRDAAFPITRQRFDSRVQQARLYLQHLAPQLIQAMESLFETHREIRLLRGGYPGVEADLARLMPPDFLRQTPYDQVLHLGRFLKAIVIRAERAMLDPMKDRQKAEQVQPFQDAVDELMDPELTGAKRDAVQALRWMVEEFRVSVFAQELGTAQKVSPKRLYDKLEQVRGMV
ncbi:MAG: ATP-dependent RNA helicase HrpA [Gemmatimonadetes bacterium]|nr:ATP-dependent RNA helicase HrpA [Gemmatimonadota bacterium]MYK50129.1 ATP-dependent RNA helicase HrpA [Gemmatimonadota bacterium]